MAEFDLLISNTGIVDGRGSPEYKGSIGVKDGRITGLGEVEGDAKEVIDGEGLVALPGFIDSHSHHDHWILQFPLCESYVLQGITTFIGGQCGTSPAPIGDLIHLDGISFGSEFMEDLVPYKYYPDKDMFPREEVSDMLEDRVGYRLSWRTMREFFEVVEEKGITCNFVPLVGHRNVRSLVLEEDYKRAATKAEIGEMTEHIHQAMGDGCVGMSYGLDYDPDVFAERDELVAHAEIMKEYDGIIVPHSRRTGRRRGMKQGHRLPDKINALKEVIGICRESGARMNIAHLFTGWYILPDNPPEIIEEASRRATLDLINEAINEGLDISFDVIPEWSYHQFSRWEYLCSQFLPWLRIHKSREAFGEWLKIPDCREELKEAISEGKWFIRVQYNPNTNPNWMNNITVLEHDKEGVVNKTIGEIAEDRDADPFDTWLDLIVEDPDAKCGLGSPTNPEASYHKIFLKHPSSAVGLDTYVDDYIWLSGLPPWSEPWMSTYNALPGFYQKYVKKMKTLTLEEAVTKTSTQAAARHGLKDRGVLKTGNHADIVLINLEELHATGTPLNPREKPEGIKYVIINGVITVKEKELTGKKPGQIVRRQ
jgi:N-acyl-D-aspartate/D-glutamate deacylase